MTSLSVKKISKNFGGIKALKDISLDLVPGQVTAILGENGAGKSTLLKILSGVYTEYQGQIYVNDHLVNFKNPAEAQLAGIAIIHQELNLIPDMTLTENLFLGRDLVNSWGILDSKKMNKITADFIKKLNIEAEPHTRIKNLKIGQQQLVEIAKALLTNAEIIFMDEPSSALSEKEIKNLHLIISDLVKQQKTVVYISHKMDELFAISQQYLVLRDGSLVGSGRVNEVKPKDLISLMVGRDLSISPKQLGLKSSENILEVKDLLIDLGIKSSKYKNSFSLKKGEILGLFGLMGAGRTELLSSLFGISKTSDPFSLKIEGKEKIIKSPSDALKEGISLLSEDRKIEGLALDMNIAENISFSSLKKFETLFKLKDDALGKKYIHNLGIKADSPFQKVGTLSGGNQQKVVLARCLSVNPKILLLDEPTRGVDIKAKSEIYEIIKNMAEAGLSILIVSSEIPELLTLSDRIMVMAEGKITKIFNIEEASQEELLKHAIAV